MKWWIPTVALVSWAMAVACSGDDTEQAPGAGNGDAGTTCIPGARECQGSTLKTCASDGSRWLEEECPDGTCSAGACGSGGCTPDARECVDDRLARICPSDGSGWVSLQCEPGETCSDGNCLLGGDAGTCIAGEASCATDQVVKVCENGGGAWVTYACGQDQRCDQGACVTEGADLCSPGSRICQDATVALKCADTGQGYEPQSCPTDTTCIDGFCRGSVCSVDKGRCLSYSGRSVSYEVCVDGTHLERRDCAIGETCVSGNDGAPRCVPAGDVCNSYSGVCGDPNDSSVDPTAYVSDCRDINGVRQWVLIECGPGETCSKGSCSRECKPGVTRCSGDRIGIQTCQSDATWGDVTACSGLTDPLLMCAEKQDGTAICADPLCDGSGYFPDRPRGTCVGDQILACDDSGTLGTTPEDCPSGTVCVSEPYGTPINGYYPGYCGPLECYEGEIRCDSYQSTGYQECVNGQLVEKDCGTGMHCDYGPNGPGCVGECWPGARQCTASGQIQECTAQGNWDTAQACSQGTCKEYSGTAGCLLECLPGSPVCMGASKLASDGLHSGTDSAGYCTSGGLLPTSGSACAGTETCRTLATGESLGCIECKGVAEREQGEPQYGPEPTVDRRCVDSGGGTFEQLCEATHEWGAVSTTACASCDPEVARAALDFPCPGAETCMCNTCSAEVAACASDPTCVQMATCRSSNYGMPFPDVFFYGPCAGITAPNSPSFRLFENMAMCAIGCQGPCF